MVESSAAHRKFVANVSLDRHLAKRRQAQPTFLRRNVNSALDWHSRLLAELRQRQSASGSEGVLFLLSDALVTRPNRNQSNLQYPSLEMLKNLTKGQKPALKVDGLRISPFAKEIQGLGDDIGEHQELDAFLPDPRITIRALCRVDVIVRATQEKTNLYQSSRDGVVVGKSNRDFLSIELESPFFVDISKLKVTNEHRKNGQRIFESTVLDDYRMVIILQCLDSQNGDQILNFMESKSLDDDRGDAPPPILHAYWDNLPTCPEESDLLELKRHGQPRALVGYGLRSATAQMPTPDSLAQSEGSRTVRITYLFNEGDVTRSMTRDGLECVICGDGIVHTSFERLLMHYSVNHSHFRCEVREGTKAKSVAESRTITFSLIERLSESPTPELEFSWIAPTDRPFDEAAYIKGEDTWTGHTQTRTRQSARRGRLPKELLTRTSSTNMRRIEEKKPIVVRDREHKDPTQVPNLPKLTRDAKRRHKVPNLPDVRFYRTTSKRIAEPGEELSESDEEVDEAWLEQSHHSELAVVDMSKAGLDFHRAFNQHLGFEQTASNVLARDAFVRFCRKFRTELLHREWRHQFDLKMELLGRHGIVDEATIGYCNQLLAGPPGVDGVQDGDGRPSLVQEAAAANGRPDRAANHRRTSKQGTVTPNGIGKLPFEGRAASEALAHKRAASGEVPRSVEAALLKAKKKQRTKSPEVGAEEADGKNALDSTSRSDSPASSRLSSSRTRRRWDAERGFVELPDTPRGQKRQDRERPSAINRTRLSAASTTTLDPIPNENLNNTPYSALPSHSHHDNSRDNLPTPSSDLGKFQDPSPATELSDDGLCVCNRPAVNERRGTIECESRACKRRVFHLACVGLERRFWGWKCEGCVGGADAGE
ncbi:hypothetical protein MBLNU230_g7049t1 [Neophaeotheca triangularis]